MKQIEGMITLTGVLLLVVAWHSQNSCCGVRALEFIDKKSADACIFCLCDFRKACKTDKCDGERLSATNYFCGPFRISKPYWKDGGSERLVNETATEETAIFENCTKTFECSKRVVLAYAKKFMQDCDEDGKFTCNDIGRLHDLGPDCKGDLPLYTRNRLDRINVCYERETGKTDTALAASIPSNDTSSKWSLVYMIVSPVLLVVIIALSVAIYCIWKLRKVEQCSGDNGDQSNYVYPKKTLKTMEGEAAVNLPLTCIIPPDEIVIDRNKCLGQGQFGMVYEGLYNGERVAIKAPKFRLVVNSIDEFERELEMMARVGNHRNIVSFLGAEISQIRRGTAYVVLEFSPYGSLLSFMRDYVLGRPRVVTDSENLADGYVNFALGVEETEDDIPTLNYRMKINWCHQIASGMAFLESKKVLHGDLAARNILLFDLQIVKISDFGFARSLGSYDDYEKREGPLPWRWMAPESLERRLFSLKSDIWSYGVTVWEIFTFGIVPYTTYDTCTAQFVIGLKNGERLPRPDETPDDIYATMSKCWELLPEDRPTFECLENMFKDFAEHCTGYCSYEEIMSNAYYCHYKTPKIIKSINY